MISSIISNGSHCYGVIVEESLREGELIKGELASRYNAIRTLCGDVRLLVSDRILEEKNRLNPEMGENYQKALIDHTKNFLEQDSNLLSVAREVHANILDRIKLLQRKPLSEQTLKTLSYFDYDTVSISKAERALQNSIKLMRQYGAEIQSRMDFFNKDRTETFQWLDKAWKKEREFSSNPQPTSLFAWFSKTASSWQTEYAKSVKPISRDTPVSNEIIEISKNPIYDLTERPEGHLKIVALLLSTKPYPRPKGSQTSFREAEQGSNQSLEEKSEEAVQEEALGHSDFPTSSPSLNEHGCNLRILVDFNEDAPNLSCSEVLNSKDALFKESNNKIEKVTGEQDVIDEVIAASKLARESFEKNVNHQVANRTLLLGSELFTGTTLDPFKRQLDSWIQKRESLDQFIGDVKETANKFDCFYSSCFEHPIEPDSIETLKGLRIPVWPIDAIQKTQNDCKIKQEALKASIAALTAAKNKLEIELDLDCFWVKKAEGNLWMYENLTYYFNKECKYLEEYKAIRQKEREERAVAKTQQPLVPTNSNFRRYAELSNQEQSSTSLPRSET